MTGSPDRIEGEDRPSDAPEGDGRRLEPERWVERHADYLYRFAILRVREPDLAADLVQEAFLDALRGSASFSGRSSERTWLAAILKHKIIDRRRKVARESARLDAAVEAAGPSAEFDARGIWIKGPGPWADQPDQLLARREFWEALRGCLDALPASLAEPFILRELDGLETVAICKTLGISATNLWVRLHRARLALRTCLESRWSQSGDPP